MRIIVNEIFGVADNGQNLHYIEAFGSSNENKPTEETVGGPIIDGSVCIETNTGKAYFFNGEVNDWIVIGGDTSSSDIVGTGKADFMILQS